MTHQALHEYRKRRRLNEIWEESDNVIETTSRNELQISDLPIDNLLTIFNWIPATFLVSNVQYVSKFFQKAVKEYLYRKYMKNFSRLVKIYNKFITNFNVSQNVQTHKQMFKILTKIEIIVHEYKILEACIWRYMRLRKSQFIFCYCFVKILDTFDYLYYRLYNKKGNFGSFSKNEKTLQKFIKLIKTYLFHFEHHFEVHLNKNCFVSGAKICDILDSCIFTNRVVMEEKHSNGICTLKLHYSLANAWFHVFPIFGRKPGPITWEEQQRLMYLRLRRLASTHTYQQLQIIHCRQAQQFIGLNSRGNVSVESSIYTGFGDFDEELFFYGNFNIGGYKFKVRKLENRNVTSDETTPNNLHIFIDLVCPLEQAPLILYKKHYLHVDNQPYHPDILKRRSTRLIKNQFYMKIEFLSEAQYTTYFPTSFQYIVSEEERLKRDDKVSRLFINKRKI